MPWAKTKNIVASKYSEPIKIKDAPKDGTCISSTIKDIIVYIINAIVIKIKYAIILDTTKVSSLYPKSLNLRGIFFSISWEKVAEYPMKTVANGIIMLLLINIFVITLALASSGTCPPIMAPKKIDINIGNTTPKITENIFPTKFLNSYFTKLLLISCTFTLSYLLSIYFILCINTHYFNIWVTSLKAYIIFN